MLTVRAETLRDGKWRTLEVAAEYLQVDVRLDRAPRLRVLLRPGFTVDPPWRVFIGDDLFAVLTADVGRVGNAFLARRPVPTLESR